MKAASAAVADAATADAAPDAAAKRSADLASAKPLRRRAKSTTNLAPSRLPLGDDEGGAEAEEGTGLHQIDLTALTETNDAGTSDTAVSGEPPSQGANPLSPPRPRLFSLRGSFSERTSGVGVPHKSNAFPHDPNTLTILKFG